MTPQEQEIKKMRSEITEEMRAVYKANMKVFNWNIPENDNKRSAKLILEVMQDALDDLKTEVSDGKYNNY